MRATKKVLSEIDRAFGFVPPLFLPLQENPLQLKNLWQQTEHAYVQSPLPPLFKEKLTAYLSRFCEVPYCLICHSCTLHDLGMTGSAILELLETPPLTQSDLEAQLKRLPGYTDPLPKFPESDTANESLLIDAAALLFLEEDSGNIQRELRRILAPDIFHSFLAMLTFVKTVHYWTQSHPEIDYEADARAMNHLGSLIEQEPQLADFFRQYTEKVQNEWEIRSGRRRDAERLLQSEERFRTLAETTAQIVWRLDDLGNLIEITGWDTFTGQDKKQALAGKWIEAVHPADQEPLTHTWNQGIIAQRPFSFEMQVKQQNGQYTYFASSIVPVLRNDGTTREWIGASTNIDRRRRAEMALTLAHQRQQRIADSLQRSLLIVPSDDSFHGLAFETVYEPATDEARVGGDFYDIFAVDHDRVALFVGDVSGKGLEAAALTAEVKFTLRAYLREDPRASKALVRMNRFLVDTRSDFAWRESTFVCLTLAILDTRTGSVEFAVAGAERPLLIRHRGGIEEVQVSDLPLGILRDVPYRTDALNLAPGDILLLATDGLAEARSDDRMLGSDGVRLLIESAQRMESLTKMGKALLKGAQAFSGGILKDDVCLLLARRCPPTIPWG